MPSVRLVRRAALGLSAVGQRLGEVRIAVHADDADDARRIIESHRTELRNGQVVPPARRVRDAAAGDRLPLPRSRPARARDDAHLARQRGRQRRRRRQRVAGVSRRRACSASSSPTCCSASSREFDEGQKSKIKASLVSTATLARQAERLRLGDHLLLGRGEEKTGGRRKQALLADGYEALIAAIYLDGGIEQARAFIAREFAPLLDEVRRDGVAGQDYKSALQELLQSRDQPLPEYRLVGTIGPDHRKLFEVEVVVNGERAGGGDRAEQEGGGAGSGAARAGRAQKRSAGRRDVIQAHRLCAAAPRNTGAPAYERLSFGHRVANAASISQSGFGTIPS